MPYTNSLIFFALLIVIISQLRAQQHFIIRKIQQKRKGNLILNYRILETYKHKECIIMTSGAAMSTNGTITDIEDGWLIIVDKKGKSTALNCDYICSIKEK